MTVAEDPRRGFGCDEIRSGYRKFSVGSHVLFFQTSATHVVIVRILHRGWTSIGISADAFMTLSTVLALSWLHSPEARPTATRPRACAWAMALATVAIVGMPPSCIDSTAVEGTITMVELLRLRPS